MKIDKENLAKNHNEGLPNMSIHKESLREHDKNVKNLKLKSISTYRQKSALKGLSIPKMVSINKTKVKTMAKNKIKPNAQDDEQNKNVKAQELAISSKKVVKTRKEVKRMKNKTKEVKKRQRKGKSLLTAFRINRMEKRLTLNLNRTEIKHGKYI